MITNMTGQFLETRFNQFFAHFIIDEHVILNNISTIYRN